MRRHIIHFTRRHEPRGHALTHMKSGIGALIGMATVGALAAVTGLPFLIAPFGATAVLVFSQPRSPLAQPANVLGGYVIAVFVASGMLGLFGDSWIAAVAAVGITIALMSMLRVTHPPAGAIPLVAQASHIHLPLLIGVVVAGSLIMILVAVLHHYIPPRQQYPLRAQ
jgi:CBS-domain-containing membrane protein